VVLHLIGYSRPKAIMSFCCCSRKEKEIAELRVQLKKEAFERSFKVSCVMNSSAHAVCIFACEIP